MSDRPQAEWPAVIESLQEHFTYPLELHPLEDAELSPADRKRLLEGQVVFREHEEQTQLLKRVRNSEQYLFMVMGYTQEEALAEEVRGIVYLVESRFIGRDESEWPEVLEDLRHRRDVRR